MWSIFWNGSKFVRYTHPIKATVYYLNYCVDLLTGARSERSFLVFLENLEKQKLQFLKNKDKKVYHLYYEAGLELNNLHSNEDDVILALELEYKYSHDWKVLKDPKRIKLTPKRAVSKKKYKEDFDKVQNHLKNGDCYQVNLTYDFEYSIDTPCSAEDICSSLWASSDNIAPYAHASFIEQLDLLILSNSPECLFNSKINQLGTDIWTMPIKGTMPRSSNWKKDWKKLRDSKKDQGELNMITDLLRNDLTRIELTSSNVIRKNSPLLVPRIIHQYSLISTKLSKEVNLLQIIKAMFPGGSITGAPKQRVMNILRDIEKRNRGIYCGSTILINKNECSSSINIRTASIDLKSRKLTYSAGGGITLLSNCEDEFLEMYLKKDSFIRNL